MSAVGDARKREEEERRKKAAPEPLEVGVGVTVDDTGEHTVVLQLPDSWITTGADNARAIASALVQAADTLDARLAALVPASG
jgi:hypothetical protein